MQVYAYTDSVIEKLNSYARGRPIQNRLTYALIHPEVYVPLGCLPIRITQFSRADSVTGRPRNHHWAIFIPTSRVPGIGHYYELAGDQHPYQIRSTLNNYNTRHGAERGSHTVGYVYPLMMPYLEAHFACVPVECLKRDWDSRNWVCDALQGLDHALMQAVGLKFDALVTQMAIVETAWEKGEAD